jgi:polysaccharide pyruvyl transferase WcaK-like protein
MEYLKNKNNIKVAILGADFTTGNLGVSVLAESSIRCILNRWPNADINILGGDKSVSLINLDIEGRSLQLKNIPIRFSPNIFLPNHLFVFIIYGIMRYVIPVKKIQEYFINRNKYIKELTETDYVMDITGGDSFSDIYGMRRYLWGLSPKCMVLLYQIPLIFLPQTYGPFEKIITRLLARFVIGKASLVYSRDDHSLVILEKLFGSNIRSMKEKIRFSPDVGFVLPPSAPAVMQIKENFKRTDGDIIIGLNISGLLYHGGYTRNNMFELNVEYGKFISSIIEYFMTMKHAKIILVPHVFVDNPADAGVLNVEDDLAVCREVYIDNAKKYPGRIFTVDEKYNHREIKYIIGMCDFFLGSRMHSCIAALSQCIPAVGLAYSRKFAGVFASIGLEKCVTDMRNETHDELMSKISRLFDDRKEISEHLKQCIPEIKRKAISIFEAIED